MGRGRSKQGVRISLKEVHTLSQLWCLGSTWSASTQKESKDLEWFRKAETIRDGERKNVPGWRSLFGNQGEGIAFTLLESLQPLWSGRDGAACRP